MDPTETLGLLIAALEWGDNRAAREAVGNLTDWHDSGGFMPRWPQGAPECPRGLAAYHLGRLVGAMDSASGPKPYKFARADYAHVLSAIKKVVS